MQDRDALVAAPIYEVHVPFSGNPLRALEARVTGVVYYKADDREVDPDGRPAAETQEMMRHVTVQGFVAIGRRHRGRDVEALTRQRVNHWGWESIEVRSLHKKVENFLLFLLLTGPHAFGWARGICGRA
jgi:hypothetical protein